MFYDYRVDQTRLVQAVQQATSAFDDHAFDPASIENVHQAGEVDSAFATSHYFDIGLAFERFDIGFLRGAGDDEDRRMAVVQKLCVEWQHAHGRGYDPQRIWPWCVTHSEFWIIRKDGSSTDHYGVVCRPLGMNHARRSSP